MILSRVGKAIRLLATSLIELKSPENLSAFFKNKTSKVIFAIVSPIPHPRRQEARECQVSHLSLARFTWSMSWLSNWKERTFWECDFNCKGKGWAPSKANLTCATVPMKRALRLRPQDPQCVEALRNKTVFKSEACKKETRGTFEERNLSPQSVTSIQNRQRQHG